MSFHKLSLTRFLPTRTKNLVSNRGILVSFPKSGRTWLRVIFHDLGVELHKTHNGADHKHATPYYRLSPYGQGLEEHKVIFLHRDPMDTVVSGYFQATRREGVFEGDISSFIRHEGLGIEKIVYFNIAWFEQGCCQDFLIMSYEAMKADDIRSVKAILDFLEIEVSSHRLIRAVKNARFDKMRRRESSRSLVNALGNAMRPKNRNDPESYKVRKGQVGGYREYLSEADIAYCRQIMEKYDYHRIRDEAEARFGPGLGSPLASSSE